MHCRVPLFLMPCDAHQSAGARGQCSNHYSISIKQIVLVRPQQNSISQDNIYTGSPIPNTPFLTFTYTTSQQRLRWFCHYVIHVKIMLSRIKAIGSHAVRTQKAMVSVSRHFILKVIVLPARLVFLTRRQSG